MEIASARPAGSVTAQQSRALVAQLKRSRLYRDYEHAFRDTTGLPLSLRAIEAFDLPHQGDPNESPLCALLSHSNKSCAACLQLHRRVEEETRAEPTTLTCFAGLRDSAVPVRVGETLVAFLQTGQVLFDRPEGEALARATRRLLQLSPEMEVSRLEDAYLRTRVVSEIQYESILRLLAIFAQHLSALSRQVIAQSEMSGMPSIAKARTLIDERSGDPLSLHDVAQAVNMSAFYFCKMFRKVTGMTFTTYLARVRVEKVKNLLLDPNRHVSEAAYEAGFQSLSQFNRVFRRIEGQSPSLYRQARLGRG